MIGQPDWYFTAAWDPVAIRRGDALGFRAGADYFGKILAPGLSNATVDARWISLLSWCLKWSHLAWRKAGGGDLSTRDGQRARYAWLRPLELLWVDRALEAGQPGERVTGQLRGRRSIERWRNQGKPPADKEVVFRFGMSADQFRNYRQTGMYGAYRVLLRAVKELTTGDGWTPAETALRLADLVNARLPHDARLDEEDFEARTQWERWKDREAMYWTDPQSGRWKNWRIAPARGFLPTPTGAMGKPLGGKEQSLLESALFGAGSRRRATAEALARIKGARSHTEVCDALARDASARSGAFSRNLGASASLVALLPAFTRFAEAAMDAMHWLWHEVNRDKEQQAPAINKLAANCPELQQALAAAREAGGAWLRAPGRDAFVHHTVVTELAQAMQTARTPLEQLRALMAHHQTRGGGLRWFREQDGKIVPQAPDTGVDTSYYGFRLRPLSHLAGQCGVARMDGVLDALGHSGFTDFDDADEADEVHGETP